MQPKYLLLRNSIFADIQAGRWKPGEKLPAEQEFARTSPFSLGTVQRALRVLVEEGIISRVHGSGTYVSSGHGKIEDVAHCRFLNDDETGFLPVYSDVVSRERVQGTGPWSRYFRGGGRRLTRIDRILDVNGEFSVYAQFYFDAARFGGLLAKPLAQLSGANFKEILRREFDVPITDISQRMLISPFPARVAKAIGIPTRTVGAVMEIVGRSAASEMVYYQQIFIPPSARKLVTQPA